MLGRYVLLVGEDVADDKQPTVDHFMHNISAEEKGKLKTMTGFEPHAEEKKGKEQEMQASNAESGHLVVEYCSLDEDVVKLSSDSPTVVERCSPYCGEVVGHHRSRALVPRTGGLSGGLRRTGGHRKAQSPERCRSSSLDALTSHDPRGRRVKMWKVSIPGSHLFIGGTLGAFKEKRLEVVVRSVSVAQVEDGESLDMLDLKKNAVPM